VDLVYCRLRARQVRLMREIFKQGSERIVNMDTAVDAPVALEPAPRPGPQESWDKLSIEVKVSRSAPLWIRFDGAFEGRRFEWMLRGNEPEDFVRTTAEAAQALGIDPALLEAKLVPEVIRCRKAWMKYRDKVAVMPPSSDAVDVAVVNEAGAKDEFEASFTDLPEFMGRRFDHDWLVAKVLVKGQTTVIGGPKKALKSSIGIDLALSLSSGKPFLGTFEVNKVRKVALITAESGAATVQNAMRRIAKERGIAYPQKMLYLRFRMPRLGDDKALKELRTDLKRLGAEVVVFDPLYLALAGSTDTNAANLYSIGPLILNAAKVCLDVGATPIFLHHTTKASHALKGRHGEALDLDDLAFSGIAEACRQWWVLSHRTEFDPDSGTSKLWMRVGGSAGHAGLYALDVCEGVMLEDFSGRGWKVTVQPASRAIEAEKKDREIKKVAAKQQKERQQFLEVLSVLGREQVAKTTPEIADAIGFGEDKTRSLLQAMRRLGLVAEQETKKKCGTATRPFVGWVMGPRAAQYLGEGTATGKVPTGTMADPGRQPGDPGPVGMHAPNAVLRDPVTAVPPVGGTT
jgi:hypothetical protein